MWKGFFGLLLFVLSLCVCLFSFMFIITGFAWFVMKDPIGPPAILIGMIAMYISGTTCRVLAEAAVRVFAEDAKNPLPARYIPGQHKHDPPRNL